MEEQIVCLNDLFTTYAYIKFPSRADANQWLRENGFEESGIGFWIRHGGATLNFLGRVEHVKGDMTARVHELKRLEEVDFKPN